ncbi:MAG: hypothetical protein HY727_15230 [Candidatus Rokubacteria bacterium]|nr:hypothetical protein [Candidatus Rokubacteria bacterium]
MPVANVKTRWVGGDLVFYDKAENIIATWDGTNRKLTLPAGSVLDLSAATGILSLAAGEVALADLVAASLDGTIAKVVAASNVIGGLLVVHHVLADQAGGADKNVVLTHKTRVLDVIVVNKAVGGAADTITVKNGATAITDAIDTNKADKTVTRAGTIDDAQDTIAAGGTLRVTKGDGANDANCDVYVLGMRVA